MTGGAMRGDPAIASRGAATDAATVRRAVKIALTIPDNEARTALETLRRRGVPLGDLERADLWIFACEPAAAARLEELVRADEAIFNPNKHRLVPVDGARPGAGEVWIDDDRPAHAGRLPGVRWARRCTAWTLSTAGGGPADQRVIADALDALLRNPAYQRVVEQI